jgi:hypothetical protein
LAFDGRPHKNKPNVDNLVKGLMDAVYEDDAHIWAAWFEKRWGETGLIEILELTTASTTPKKCRACNAVVTDFVIK